MRRTAVVLLVGLLLLLSVNMGTACENPVVVPDNPSCEDLGYQFGFKPQPEPPPTGTYTFPDGMNTVDIVSDGTYFDWSSTLSIDAVLAKGGPDANVYFYDPEAYSDTGLNSPINPNTESPYGLSHITFCYDYEVVVVKDANPTFTRTWQWDIAKDVTPGVWSLFNGDSGTSRYDVTVTKTGYADSNHAVSGNISVYNPSPYDASITGVTDLVDGISAPVDCGESFPYPLAPFGTLACTYSTPLPDGASRVNVATVTTTGDVGGGEATADVIFGDPTTVVNDSVNVDDTNGGSWLFTDTGTVFYDVTFACNQDGGLHPNEATIRETGQNDDAQVQVNCYALAVTKDTATAFNRYYTWTIDKWADQTELTLSLGQQFLVNYQVTVGATYYDADWAVSGNISVYNPAHIAAMLNGVADVVSPDIAAQVECDVTFPYLLAPGATLECTYNADLPDASSRFNTATATLQNYNYDHLMNATPAGTTDFSGSADVVFGSVPADEIDECIDVSDSYAGFLGTVCYTAPFTFYYTRMIGPYAECGWYTVDNVASFVTNDTGATGFDTWTVTVDVPCDGGCTLTQGYWKTHSVYGPAPEDDTWDLLLLLGPDKQFFKSKKSYYEVLWTPPAGGNAYYILAHQYIAAELNWLNGADFSEAQDAFDKATGLFEKYTPEEVAKLKGNKRAKFINFAETLDEYNKGDIGPGHCSEEGSKSLSSELGFQLSSF